MNKKILMSIVAVLLCITIGASVGNFIGDSVKVNADIVVSPHESDVFFEESVSESESEKKYTFTIPADYTNKNEVIKMEEV